MATLPESIESSNLKQDFLNFKEEILKKIDEYNFNHGENKGKVNQAFE